MVLDTTIAGVTSNSYLSVAEADGFAGARLGREPEQWLAAVTAIKEKALQQATSDIDAHVRVGEAYSDPQSLRFPRLVDVDTSNVAFLLPKIKEATFWQAAYLVTNAEIMSDASTRRARGLFSFSEDNLGGSVALDPDFGLLSRQAQQLLNEVVTGARGFLGTMHVRSHGQRRIPDWRDWTNW